MANEQSRSLYHRWRSRSFSEVVAQEHVTRTLRNAVAAGRIVHAYLLCGPRGTGKTSTARILAKAVNCLDPQQGEPCNRCASCLSVNEGRAIDLIEIDAASNRGIDDARELREKIRYSPAEARFKVYIIDEAHMLTSEASNALLKTLEEPPDHAILILATTEAHKILPTIASRCQRFDFRRIPLQAMVEQLQMICEREGLVAGAGVLDRVSRMARGSLRDAESLLDQLVAYCGSNIDLVSTREILGLTGEEAVPEFAEAMRSGDLALGFRLIDTAASNGADLRHFSRELVDHLRALMLAKSGADIALIREFRPEELSQLQGVAECWDYAALLVAIRTFGEIEGRLRLEALNQVHLETALLEVVLHSDRRGLGDRERAVEGLPADASDLDRRGARRAPSPPPKLSDEHVEADPDRRGAPPASRGGDPLPLPPRVGEGGRGDEGASLPLDLATVRAEWPRIVADLTATNATLGFALPGCYPVEVSDGAVVLGFEKTLWKDKMDRPDVRHAIAEALTAVFGVSIRVRLKFGVKITREVPESGQDAVVDAAIRDFGFHIA